MSTLKITNGRIICPYQQVDRVADLYVKDGIIEAIGQLAEPADEVIDASGKLVCPGLIDMHVHLREPGDLSEETIASGSAAAISGGFTTIVAMPNTDPPIDNPAAVEFVINRARQANLANVFAVAAITKGRQGKELSEMALLNLAGAIGFSDDGSWVESGSVMSKAMAYARQVNLPIISHCEDPLLVGRGVMNAGAVATRLGLSGMPRAAEETAIARDIILARDTGARIHITHVSTAGAVELIRRAKNDGIAVTADATPHHLTLTDEAVEEYDSVYRMNPPLRTARDVEALRAGLLDGTIDAIASDHAPHSAEEKQCEFDKAAAGVIGLESTLAVLVTEFVETGIMSWSKLLSLLTVGPATVLGLPKGTLAPGADADILILDPSARWKIEPERFVSLSRNCPFRDKEVIGQAEITIVGGMVKEA